MTGVLRKGRALFYFKGPSDSNIKLTIEELNLARNTMSSSCYHWLEIRYNLVGQTGIKYVLTNSVCISENFISFSFSLLLVSQKLRKYSIDADKIATLQLHVHYSIISLSIDYGIKKTKDKAI